MKVVCHPADSGGCGLYRVRWPAEALAAQGHDVTVRYADDGKYRCLWQPSVFGDRIVSIDGDLDADVVVLQRPIRRHTYDLMKALQAKGATVVVEIDDDFHTLHPRNPAWKGTRQLDDPDANRDWLKKSCEIADLVTVSTPALAARYGGHGRVAVLPNYVPERYLELGASHELPDRHREGTALVGLGSGAVPGDRSADTAGDAASVLADGLDGNAADNHRSGLRAGRGDASSNARDRVVVGWSGSTDTHPGDLEVTDGAIAEALGDTDAAFHVVGTGKGVQRALRLSDDPPATGWLPIDDYPSALAAFDIGIVPLRPSQFNEAKSALKMMELAATGSVPVGSPTSDNLRVWKLGVGDIAPDRDAWYRTVQRLITDPARRADDQARSREAMADLTIEKNAWRWLEAWAGARQLTAA